MEPVEISGARLVGIVETVQGELVKTVIIACLEQVDASQLGESDAVRTVPARAVRRLVHF